MSAERIAIEPLERRGRRTPARQQRTGAAWVALCHPRIAPAYTRFVARRLAACALTFIFAATPVAIAVCEAACADRDAQAATASHHSCHAHLALQQGPAIGAIHLCGHDDGLPTSLEQTTVALESPAVIPGVALPAPPALNSRVGTATVDSSPPTQLSRQSQLRI
jgi:hypothetical protein